ncbi:MAG: deoxyribodipyrimidine photo-lyase, partial [Deinococcales bacterium]
MATHDSGDARMRWVRGGLPREGGRYVLYWMEQSQRSQDNHALEAAVASANELGCPVVVVFALDPDDPGVSERTLCFVLEGLVETTAALRDRGIWPVVRVGSPPDVALALAAEARLLVTDRGYLRHQRRWRDQVAERATCPVVEVEADAVVPVDVASSRLEVAARTFRPRVMPLIERFLELPEPQAVRVRADGWTDLSSQPIDTPARLARELSRGRGPAAVSAHHHGGTRAARARLERFVSQRLPRYAQERSAVPSRSTSELSMYLHFGQLSPLRLAFEVRAAGRRVGSLAGGASGAGAADGADAFLEQLVVRRELALNLVTNQPAYDRYEAIPAWARATLDEHRADPREAVYDEARLVAAETDDPYWNAAMLELRESGSMHPHMRMYWGKRLLAWGADPRQAFERALRLNDRYFLDGRDPNSYANVGWCF